MLMYAKLNIVCIYNIRNQGSNGLTPVQKSLRNIEGATVFESGAHLPMATISEMSSSPGKFIFI